MNCKKCGYEMIIPIFRLDSNDSRMAGDYCSRRCIDERRKSIPTFHDLSYLRKKEGDVVELLDRARDEDKDIRIVKGLEDSMDEAEAEVWKNLFG